MKPSEKITEYAKKALELVPKNIHEDTNTLFAGQIQGIVDYLDEQYEAQQITPGCKDCKFKGSKCDFCL